MQNKVFCIKGSSGEERGYFLSLSYGRVVQAHMQSQSCLFSCKAFVIYKVGNS